MVTRAVNVSDVGRVSLCCVLSLDVGQRKDGRGQPSNLVMPKKKKELTLSEVTATGVDVDVDACVVGSRLPVGDLGLTGAQVRASSSSDYTE